MQLSSILSPPVKMKGNSEQIHIKEHLLLPCKARSILRQYLYWQEGKVN